MIVVLAGLLALGYVLGVGVPACVKQRNENVLKCLATHEEPIICEKVFQ